MGECAIFGGSFDPVHNGHLILATELIETLQLERLLVIPVAWSPLKNGAPRLDSALRLRLCQLAFEHLPEVEVSPREIERSGRSYTIDTVDELGLKGRPYLLIGEDSVRGLHAWHRIEELVQKVRFVVASRPGTPEHDLPQIAGLDLQRVPITAVDLSSTAIRERLRSGRPLEGWLPTPVAERLRASL